MILIWRRIQSMGAKIGRSDFRRQYPAVYQGLFVFSGAKRLPKDQPIINLGYELSERLMGIPSDRRCFEIDNCLRSIVETYIEVTLSHIEILFTPSLKLDAIGVLLSLCRNRKIRLLWPIPNWCANMPCPRSRRSRACASKPGFPPCFTVAAVLWRF